jgi:hypothetical protein
METGFRELQAKRRVLPENVVIFQRPGNVSQKTYTLSQEVWYQDIGDVV